jgi:hypothetical protein
MWKVNGPDLQMADGDYGLTLPITISGAELTSADSIRITIRRTPDGVALIDRDLTPTDNTVNFTLSEEESARFAPGKYVYSLDWYRNGSMMCNIIPIGNFKVVDKV